MIKYAKDYNPILSYWADIESGKVVVCDKLRRTYEKIVCDLGDAESEYYYSPARANHVLEFAENYCHLIQGRTGPVVLEKWEKAMLATIFGFVDATGCRKYQEAILIVGKKNGKSLIASIVGLYLLMADGEPGPEVYAVATKRDQAKKVWLVAKQMVKKSPVLRKRIRTLVSELACDGNNGTFKPLASDADTLDGLNVHGVLMDEVHQWKAGKALYDIMADGTTARDQPLIMITTTAGTIREDIYDEKYDEAKQIINGYFDPDGYKDERRIAFIYELDHREEWTNPDCWQKANPGLGTIKKREQLEEKVERAKANPKLVKNLVCKEFNIRETGTDAWLTFDQVNNTATFDLAELRPRYGIGGVDLSATTDLTAAVVVFQVRDDDRVYVLPMFWIPEDRVEEKLHERAARYAEWLEQGYIRTCPGNRIRNSFVTDWFREVQNEMDIFIPWVGYDRAMSGDWVAEMQGEFGQDAMVPVAQGAMTLSAPMKTLGADLSGKRVIYQNNPVLKWCITNTSILEDTNANIRPVKPKHTSIERIDGLAALLDAYVVLIDKNAEYQSLL